jgi:hypothetical protein
MRAVRQALVLMARHAQGGGGGEGGGGETDARAPWKH